MKVQRFSSGERFSITPGDAIGAGGEARVYAVPPEFRHVAKIYHRPSDVHARKLRAMLANPPEDPMAAQSHISIAWPLDLLYLVYGEHTFAGYLMPRVSGMRPIFNVYNPSLRRKNSPLFNYRYLHRAARNLASAVNALHHRGYVIGDINESNILVSETALVTLVDTDSFQVPDLECGSVYRCPVGKAEYTPPELQGKRFSHIDRAPEHDLFGLAVLIFQLLMEGTHPFAGLYQSGGDPPPYEDRILKGHFAYGTKTVPYRPMPIAPSLDILHPRLKQLFLRCFDDGHSTHSVRPDARMWQSALQEAEHELIACRANMQHFFGSHLPACPWCLRTKELGGRDPFPLLPVQDIRPPRRPSASRASGSGARTLAGSPSTSSSLRVPVQPNPVPPTPSWASNASLSASVTGGIPGALPPPGPVPFPIPRNSWAWGAIAWAVMAMIALPIGLTGLSWVMALLALGFGFAGWKLAQNLAGNGKWISVIAAVLALSSLALRPFSGAVSGDRHILTARTGGVRSLCFSPDGATLAAGTSRVEDSSLTGGQINLWDVRTETLQQTLSEFSGDVVSVSYSPDGRNLAVGNDTPFGTGEVILQGVSSRGLYQQIFKEKHHLRQVVYSPDGTRIAAVGQERTVHIWDAHSLELLTTVEEPTDAMSLAFSPDNSLLAVGTESPYGSIIPSVVTVWDVSTGQPEWSKAAHGSGVRTVAFSPDSRTLATGGNDGALCFWNARKGKLLRRVPAHSYGIAALAYSPDGHKLASAELLQNEQGGVNEIVLRDALTGQPLQTLTGNTDYILSVVFSPDSKILASGCRDGTIRLWPIH